MANLAPKKKEEGGGEEWLMTFGDMMALLLTFFVLLVALMTPDKKKFDSAIQSIQSALGAAVMTGQRALVAEQKAEASFQNLGSQVKQLINEGNLQDVVDIKVTERGIVLNMSGGVLFRPGSAAVERGFKPFLLEIANMVKKLPYKILVEGHTDDIKPGDGPFPSNWELSAARAAAVVRVLIQEGGVEAERFSATGYAEVRPLFAPTPENRVKNRRVEIIISREGQSG